jgi:hypothetical protein
MNKVEQQKKLVEKMGRALADAEAKLKAAQERAEACEPEEAVECGNALTVATAAVRKARRDLEAAQAKLSDAEQEFARAEVARCRPLAEHETFLANIAPLVKKVLDCRQQVADAIDEAERVVAAQNAAADVCGAQKVGIGHVRAHVVAALSRANVAPLPAEWLQPVRESSALRGLVLEFCGQSRAVVPAGYTDADIVDLVLQGKNVSTIVDEVDARNRAAADQGMARVAERQAVIDEENERKRTGAWWKPSTWLPITG